MDIVFLSESVEQIEQSASAIENHRMSETAELLGCKVYYIPRNFHQCETAENALWHVSTFDVETLGIWIGYIPEFHKYEAIYNATLSKGIKLLNTPQQHRKGIEFDLFYPHIQEVTPQSIVVTSISECIDAGNSLGLPVFLKGIVQSNKQKGWDSCVANNQEELLKITKTLFQLDARTRGKVIIRKLVKLRYQRFAPNGFPMGREFRVFLYQHQVVAYGYYWEGLDTLSSLSVSEEEAVLKLAVMSSKRLNIPYIAVDIGQLESGEWIVIEICDAQFAGLSNIPILEFMNNLKSILEKVSSEGVNGE